MGVVHRRLVRFTTFLFGRTKRSTDVTYGSRVNLKTQNVKISYKFIEFYRLRLELRHLRRIWERIVHLNYSKMNRYKPQSIQYFVSTEIQF